MFEKPAGDALSRGPGSHGGAPNSKRDPPEQERTGDELFLALARIVVSKLGIRELLAATSEGLRQLVPHDSASVAIYQPGKSEFRLLQLDSSPDDGEVFREGAVLPAEDSPQGRVYASGRPLVLDRLLDRPNDPRFLPGLLESLVKTGIRSMCCVPLRGSGCTVGTLNVARRSEDGFAPSDIRLLSEIGSLVGIAAERASLFESVRGLSSTLAGEGSWRQGKIQGESNFEEIVGESAALRRVLTQAETVAPTDATVMILGETGAGKELVARAIHDLSPRRSRSFVKFNCAAIPPGLLESELFGHEKGAFTGANAQQLGRLDLAHQGTLFLDEVGDIPLELQPKLLRALQEKEFERLGSTRTIPVDVRLIAATNRDLARMVRDGQFRSDLYYRLKVFPIIVPPLRDRREDIPLLVRYFVQKHALHMNKRIETIPPETMDALVQWEWPGNVRELGNFLERAVILTKGSILHVPMAELRSPGEPKHASSSANLAEIERDHIVRVLRESRGVIGGPFGAAARLGLNRSTLNSRMRKLRISRALL